MVLVLGLLLLVSLVLSAALAALGKWWGGFFAEWEALLQVVNFVVSFAIVTGLFAAIYKIMPRAEIAWHDVWTGAIVTAFLFTIGKSLIGLYLGKSAVTSAFGAAGSMVVLLIWVYYSAQIFLLGAEFTWVYAHRSGSRVVVPGSQPAEAEARKTYAARPETAGVAERLEPVPAQAVAYPRRIDPALFTPPRQGSFDEHPVRNLGIAVACGLVVGAILRHFLPPARLLHQPSWTRRGGWPR